MASINDKKDPYSLEAEQAVLGGIFVDNESLSNVVKDILVSGHEEFLDNKNRIIYSAMLQLEKQNMRYDYATVCSYLESSTIPLNDWGGRDYLMKLVDAYPSSANIEDYSEIVHGNYLKRKLLLACSNIQEKTRNGNDVSPFSECIDYAEEQISDLVRNRRTSSFSSLEDISNELLKKVKDKMSKMEDNDVVGLKTGFTMLDQYTQGLQPEQLIILAARPGGGKSAFALNIAKNVADRNPHAHIAVFNLEMAAETVTSRILANAATINNRDIKSGNMTKQELAKLESQIEAMKNLNIHFSNESVV